ncbi:MAG: hypothetical protein U5K54_29505 [Cytophagales bacterium]|nr:hypothetical protein [Cytophagales bacterium]
MYEDVVLSYFDFEGDGVCVDGATQIALTNGTLVLSPYEIWGVNKFR